MALALVPRHRGILRADFGLPGDCHRTAGIVDEPRTADIPVILGTRLDGESLVLDLARAAPVLVTRTPRRTPDVLMPMVISGILNRGSEEDVRVVLVDPEGSLAAFADAPSVLRRATSRLEADDALRWVGAEIDRRYHKLASVQARCLKTLRCKLVEAGRESEVPPRLFVVVGDGHDLDRHTWDSTVPKSRAVGIYHIVATSDDRRMEPRHLTRLLLRDRAWAALPSLVEVYVWGRHDPVEIGFPPCEGGPGKGPSVADTRSDLDPSVMRDP